MSINISQAFKRTSANPVDESLTLTKAQMLTVNDNLMPSKYFTVCQDDGKIYLYDKTNTVDPATGRFRVFEGGGSGGATNLADLEDVLLTALADGQTLVWDDTEEKWVNSSVISNKQDKLQYTSLPEPTSERVGQIYQYTGITTASLTHGYWYECKSTGTGYAWVEISGGGGTDYTAGDGIDITEDVISVDPMPSEDMDDVISPLPSIQSRYHKYSTEEHIVGEWIDGKPIYEKTFNGSYSLSSTAVVINDIQIANVHTLISEEFVADGGTSGSRYTFTPSLAGFTNENKLRCAIIGSDTRTITMITLRYTKSE